MPSTRRAPSDPLKEKIRPRRARPTPQSLLTAGVGLDELMQVGERQFEQWRHEAKLDVIVQALQKLPLLMARYGIAAEADGKFSKEAWMHLALYLALDHEPGFQVEFEQERVGRPSAWNGAMLGKLFADVYLLRQERAEAGRPLTVSAACQVLSRRAEWKRFGHKVLVNRYHEATKGALASTIEKMEVDPRLKTELVLGLLEAWAGAVDPAK